MPGAKNYTVTINNPDQRTKDLYKEPLPDGILYFVYQIEKGAEGTEHLQGYIQLAGRMTMTSVKSHYPILAPAHLEVAKGTPKQNKDYCTKVETRVLINGGPFEVGLMQAGSGNRTDLAAAYQILKDTGDFSQVDPVIAMKYASSCLKIAALAKPPRRDDLKVICITGPTGIGKSYACHECYPGLYTPIYGNTGMWWDGYNGEEVVMIEEFRGQCQLQKMLQILDPYPLRVEVKGGSVPARYKLIIVTSNTEAIDWYPDNPMKAGATRDPERQALLRRLGFGTTKYVKANTRAQLYTQLNLAFRIPGIIAPQVTSWLPAATIVDQTVASPQVHTRPSTPTDESPPLRRQNATIVSDELFEPFQHWTDL